jgi:hypothetical protein
MVSPSGTAGYISKEAAMTRKLLAIPIVAAALIGWTAPRTHAEEAKTARGTITAIGGQSLTLKVMDHEMKFGVDRTTHVEAVGGTTKTRAAQASGRQGPVLSELLRPGQPVEVSYREEGGGWRATNIRAIARMSDESEPESSNGIVKSLSRTAMTISGSSGPAKFTQTFAIDPETKVIGRGVGTAVASKGGRAAITDLVGVGDSVSVSFHKGGDSLHASEVRVVSKGQSSSK